jgi:hypothetical protein
LSKPLSTLTATQRGIDELVKIAVSVGSEGLATLLCPDLPLIGGHKQKLETCLIHTAASFASFFLTTLVDRPLNAALLGACSTEMMQDYPLHV